MQLFPFLLGIDAVNEYLPITLFEDPTDDTHQRGFTGPVRPQQTEHSGMYLHGNGIQRLERFFLHPDKRGLGSQTENSLFQHTEPTVDQVNIDILLVDLVGQVASGNTEIPEHTEENSSPAVLEFLACPNQDYHRTGIIKDDSNDP